jgi:hypothetical protein
MTMKIFAYKAISVSIRLAAKAAFAVVMLGTPAIAAEGNTANLATPSQASTLPSSHVVDASVLTPAVPALDATTNPVAVPSPEPIALPTLTLTPETPQVQPTPAPTTQPVAKPTAPGSDAPITEPISDAASSPDASATPTNTAPAPDAELIRIDNNSPVDSATPAPTVPSVIPLNPGEVRFVAPQLNTVVDVAATSVTLQFEIGAPVELWVNDKPVEKSLIGRTETDQPNNVVTQTWYGVPLQPGSNTLKVIVNGQVVASQQVQVRSEPVRLVVETLESRIPADGRSTVTIKGQLLDAQGNRSNQDAIVTLSTTAGTFQGADANPDLDGFQVQARSGEFTATLQAGIEAKKVRLRAAARDFEAYTQLEFATNLRPTLLTGVVDLRLGARGTDYYSSFRDFLPTDGDDRTQFDVYSAVFATGHVGNWSFTVAHNSDRALNQDCNGTSTLNRESADCGNKYPVYGDSSTVDKVVRSRDSLFVRLERNQDYFMWGDYNTEELATKSQLYTSTTRELHGFKANYNIGNLQLTGFYGDNVEGFQRDTIAPDGTSGFYFLSRRLVLPGSETVFIEAEELGRPGTVVRRQQLIRGQDYDIDYDRGTLLFNDPVQRTDIAEDGTTLVQRIVATYQYESEGEASIYGGRIRYHFSKKDGRESWIAASYLNENQGVRHFELYGADALISLGNHGNLMAEFAHSMNDSETVGKVSGEAFRVEYEGQLTNGVTNRTYFRKTDTGFANNATTSFVPGQTRYGTQFTAKVAKQTSLRFQFDREENKGVAPQPLFTQEDLLTLRSEAVPGSAIDNRLTTVSAGVVQKIGKTNLEFDLIHRSRQDDTSGSEFDGSSTQLRSRLTTPITPKLSLKAQYEQTLSAGDDPIYPSRVVAGLDWKVSSDTTVSLSQQFRLGDTQYGGDNSITALDVKKDQKLGPDTTLTSRYSILGGASGVTVQRALGLKHNIIITPGLRADFSYERIQGPITGYTAAGLQFAQPFAPGQSGRSVGVSGGDSFSVGLEYTAKENFKASGRIEHRTSSQGSNTVISAGMAGKITNSLTGLMDFRQASSANQKLTGLGTTRTLKLGLAYRNPENDKFNALFRYEFRQNPSTIPDTIFLGSGTGSEDHTLATEAIYAPNWRWEFYGKVALRHSTSYLADDYVGSSTVTLSQLRAAYRVNRSLELVGEARWIGQGSPNYSEFGLVAEAGYYLTPNLRLGVGYAFGRASDRDFNGTRTVDGPFIGLTIKLDQQFQGFGIQKLMKPKQKPVEVQAVKEPEAQLGQESAVTPAPVETQLIGEAIAPTATPSSTDLRVIDLPLTQPNSPLP